MFRSWKLEKGKVLQLPVEAKETNNNNNKSFQCMKETVNTGQQQHNRYQDPTQHNTFFYCCVCVCVSDFDVFSQLPPGPKKSISHFSTQWQIWMRLLSNCCCCCCLSSASPPASRSWCFWPRGGEQLLLLSHGSMQCFYFLRVAAVSSRDVMKLHRRD